MYTEEEIDSLLVKAYYTLRRYGMLNLPKKILTSHLLKAYYLYSNIESYYGRLANSYITLAADKKEFIEENVEPYLFVLDDIDEMEQKYKRKNLYDWAAMHGIQVPHSKKKVPVAPQWANYTDMINNLSAQELVNLNSHYLKEKNIVTEGDKL